MVTQQLRCFLFEFEDLNNQRRIILRSVTGACDISRVHLPPKSAVFCVLHKGDVGRRIQRKEPPLPAFRSGALTGRIPDGSRHSDQITFMLQMQIKGAGSVEYVLLKLRSQLGQTHLNFLETHLLFRWQFSAPQTQITQGMAQHLFPFMIQSLKWRAVMQRPDSGKQRLVLGQFRPVGGQIHQSLPVNRPQFVRITYGIQMIHWPPQTA